MTNPKTTLASPTRPLREARVQAPGAHLPPRRAAADRVPLASAAASASTSPSGAGAAAPGVHLTPRRVAAALHGSAAAPALAWTDRAGAHTRPETSGGLRAATDPVGGASVAAAVSSTGVDELTAVHSEAVSAASTLVSGAALETGTPPSLLQGGGPTNGRPELQGRALRPASHTGSAPTRGGALPAPADDHTQQAASRTHGTRTAYVGGCRCAACTEANRIYNAYCARQQLYGRWDPFVDAEPVRQHVRRLMASGIGYKQIGPLAGVSTSTIRDLLYGKPGRAPIQRMRPSTAAAILAVQALTAHRKDLDRVHSAGSRRRIHALVAIGWSASKLASQVGMTVANLLCSIDRPEVSIATDRKIRDLYERLWTSPPPETGLRDRQAATRARNHGAARGWLKPADWDDELIDLTDDALAAEIRHRTESADDQEISLRNSAYRHGDRSLLAVAARTEYDRRRKARRPR